jgi:Family of unknown function (DUF6208)
MQTTTHAARRTLAKLSYYIHDATHGAVYAVLRRLRYSPRSGNADQHRWRPYSELVRTPAFVEFASIIAPRWNCHAMLASFGPIFVERELECGVSALQESAEAWTIVVMDDRGSTIAWKGSSHIDGNMVRWSLPRGAYLLAMRAYGDSTDLVSPSVVVDGVELCGVGFHRAEGLRYAAGLNSVRGRDSIAYRALHYYAFYQLEFAPLWDHASLKKQLLPVGNPETGWRYGYLKRSCRLKIRFNMSANAHVRIYVAFYNRSSFPIHWCRVREEEWLGPAFDCDAAYFVRIVRTRDLPLSGDINCETVEMIREHSVPLPGSPERDGATHVS